MQSPVSALLRAVADLIELGTSPVATNKHDGMVYAGGDARMQLIPMLKVETEKDSPTDKAEKPMIKRKRGQPYPCCGSRGTRHTASCTGKIAKGPVGDKQETKEFTCDECMWKFQTSDLNNVKCSNCGSSDVWPVKE